MKESDALKEPEIKQLEEVGSYWRRRYIDKLPLKVPEAEILGVYGGALELVTLISEEDRFDVLNAYSASLGISLRREKDPIGPRHFQFTKRPSAAHNDFLKAIALEETEKLSPVRRAARNLIENLVKQVAEITPEAMLYIISHHDLGINLSQRFPELTNRMITFLFDPGNKSTIIASDGWLHLEGIIKAHAKFLTPPDVEIIDSIPSEDNLVLKDVRLELGDTFKYHNRQRFERRNKRNKRRGRDFKEEDYEI